MAPAQSPVERKRLISRYGVESMSVRDNQDAIDYTQTPPRLRLVDSRHQGRFPLAASAAISD